MVHADRYPDRRVDDIDRHLLGIYARGLGLAIERAQLANRLRSSTQASAPYPSGVDAIADEFTDEPVNAARLSPREWDVLRSVALGKTNA
jgi:DNA-binding NarL/FixJ family response regulator